MKAVSSPLTKTALLAGALLLGAASCDDMNDAVKGPKATLTFVGDSIIDCWDVTSFFPGWDTVNEGISGSRIEYLHERAGRYTGKEIVVMIGTNNYYLMAADTRDEYVAEYVDAIIALDADFVYLYSVLPRSRSTVYDPSTDVNADIRAFNAAVKEQVQSRDDIYYIDIHDKFTRPGAEIISGCYIDGLHLNKDGYRVMTEALYQTVVGKYNNNDQA